jgi:hypothetical protein
MHDTGTWFCKIDLIARSQVCRCIHHQVIIRIPVYSQNNIGFQLTRGGLAAYKKTEPELVTVVSMIDRRWPEISIMYFAALDMFAITSEGQRHEYQRQD